MTARAHQLTLEPDRAKDYIVNLIRTQRDFAMEIDAGLKDAYGASLKDVVCIALGGRLVERADYLLAKGIVLRTRDDATHMALKFLREEICFHVVAKPLPMNQCEWHFTAERSQREHIRRMERAGFR